MHGPTIKKCFWTKGKIKDDVINKTLDNLIIFYRYSIFFYISGAPELL